MPLPKDHPEVQSLLKQLQDQHENIGKVSSFVGYANAEYLRTELWNRGWNTQLHEDGITVVLVEKQPSI